MTVNISDKDSTMTTSSSDAIRIIKKRIDNQLYNTSYPLSPSDWHKYDTDGSLPFDTDKPAAFYLHIPFCKRLCSFCEYSRKLLPSHELQSTYLRILRNDIAGFMSDNADLQLYGFDIGGGTPTALNDQLFEELLNIYKDVSDHIKLTSDFEPSIEATFETLTSHKAKVVADTGIHRISLGVQSSSKAVLSPLNRRAENIDSMRLTIDSAHKAGIRKINLDLMYGLPGQSLESIKDDIRTLESLRPEQVTVYELRTNQLKTAYKIDNQLSYEQYCILFDKLTDMGYYGLFGQNTFSLDSMDKGLSSYLRHRMFEGWQYKGFGISAQSMSHTGISYNIGKGSVDVVQIPEVQTFESFRHYALPSREIFAKYIAISGYSGGFSMKTAKHLYGDHFDSRFGNIISALENEGLITISRDRLQMTRKGYRHYGAILSMFYRAGA